MKHEADFVSTLLKSWSWIRGRTYCIRTSTKENFSHRNCRIGPQRDSVGRGPIKNLGPLRGINPESNQTDFINLGRTDAEGKTLGPLELVPVSETEPNPRSHGLRY
jgi:hypothetical protein